MSVPFGTATATYQTPIIAVPQLDELRLFTKVDRRSVFQTPLLGSWMETGEAIAYLIGQEKHILILDELPYAAAGDPAINHCNWIGIPNVNWLLHRIIKAFSLIRGT